MDASPERPPAGRSRAWKEERVPDPTLDDLRESIDRCDREIVRLINERARYGQQVGEYKRRNDLPIYAPDREQAVFDKVAGLNEGPFPQASLHAIYREIMSGTIALEAPTRVAYLGPPGTFSHLAALRKFGSAMEYIPCREIRDVFLSLSRDHADYGIVPIENSTEGSVTQTSDMFTDCEVKICSELFVEIHHNLLARCELHDVKRIVSHPQPLAQCRNWLAANAGGIEIIEAASTSKAAQRAATEQGTAAIASEAAAELYDLLVLDRCIEDRADNVTRFAVLGHDYPGPTGQDRTSVMFSLHHEAGSLAEALTLFKQHDVNLTRIQSHPSRRRAWEYSFFIDLEGHATEGEISRALADLRAISHDFIILGSYPRAERSRPVGEAQGQGGSS
jgi:chorismate mutase/prephenate dehydratase